MKKKTFIIVSAIIIFLALVASGLYFYDTTQVSERHPIVVTDSEGKDVVINKIPTTIVSLIPSATEVVYDLGMGDKVIAVDSYSNYPEDTKNKEKLETGTSLNIEKIVSLNPDVIFMSKMGQTVEQYNSLLQAGLKVVIVDAKSISGAYDTINLIGKVLNKSKESAEIVSNMKNEFEALSEKLRYKGTKTIYYEISPLQYGLWTGGKNTFENELFEMLNIKNVFSDLDGWAQVSEEQVISKNPEYIITTTQDYGTGSPVDEILSRSNWSNLTAIKDKNVYMINPDITSRPTPRLVDGAKEIVKILYGE